MNEERDTIPAPSPFGEPLSLAAIEQINAYMAPERPSGTFRRMTEALCPFKACGCGRMYTLDEWLDLPFVGVGGTEDPGDGMPAEPYELRNCVCGSTIAVSPPTGAT